MARTFALLLTLACFCLNAQQYRAFWVDAFHTGYKTPEEVDRLVDDVVSARCNAIFPCATPRVMPEG